eukprot:1526440-Heterocapsa_arctica.AAC.1
MSAVKRFGGAVLHFAVGKLRGDKKVVMDVAGAQLPPEGPRRLEIHLGLRLHLKGRGAIRGFNSSRPRALGAPLGHGSTVSPRPPA